MSLYQRIACLSTEAVETLYALGAEEYIAGISGFTTRPARARREKTKISGFSSSRIERILAVQPDLVLAFSDMQADICRELVKAGVEVHLFNQRSVAGILQMIKVVAALVERQTEAAVLLADLEKTLADVTHTAAAWSRRPRIYFEEWDEPMMCGIGWVSEMIHLAGGVDIFAGKALQQGAKDRIIADGRDIVALAPDIVIGSWCGKKFRPESVAARDGWQDIPAVRNNMVVEIKSADILSPGPASITEGLRQIQAWIARWHAFSTRPNVAAVPATGASST